MKAIERRLQALEHQADAERRRQTNRADVTLTPAERHLALLGMLGVQWGDIDAGTFAGNEYHERALVTLRDALQAIKRE